MSKLLQNTGTDHPPDSDEEQRLVPNFDPNNKVSRLFRSILSGFNAPLIPLKSYHVCLIFHFYTDLTAADNDPHSV